VARAVPKKTFFEDFCSRESENKGDISKFKK
jgi:hypothetical protein